MSGRSVTIVTSGHVSTCPRMVKAADALAAAGYNVRVVSAQFTDWATAADEDVLARRQNAWMNSVVRYDRRSSPGLYSRSGARFRAAGAIAELAGARRIPRSVVRAARGRVHRELLDAVLAAPFDLVYGSGSAISVAAEASERSGRPYALDLEDFHSAEEDGSTRRSRTMMALTQRIEREILPGAAFVTAASDAISRVYEREYAVKPATIDNVFPLSQLSDERVGHESRPLTLYWFSQTIGNGRGIEDAVVAAGMVSTPMELHLRGRASQGYLDALKSLQAERAPLLSIVHHPPGMPDDMVELASDYDIGLAIERTHPYNRAICLSNKAFVYMLAGLGLVFTKTEGQSALIDELGDLAIAYEPGAVDALAGGLRRWTEDADLLRRARKASRDAAIRRWHWEHPDERGRMLALVKSTIG